MRKFFSVLFLFQILLLGCSSKENNQNEIIVYTAMEENLIDEYIKEFNKEYPDIKLSVISSGTGDILAKLIAEKGNPQADVIWALSDLMILDDYKLLEPYTPKGIENVNEIFKDKNKKWFGISAWMIAIGVNTEELKKLKIDKIDSYFSLLLPQLKEQILMANPASSGTGYLTVNTFINLFGEAEAWKYMDELHKNISNYTSSGNAPVQIIARGEKIVGFIPAYQGLKIKKEDKFPLEVIFPKEGLGWELEGNALVNKKNIKDGSKIFLDWTLSEKGMLLHSKNRGFVTIEKYRKIEGYPSNTESYLKQRDFKKELINREEILKKWEKRYGKGE